MSIKLAMRTAVSHVKCYHKNSLIPYLYLCEFNPKFSVM